MNKRKALRLAIGFLCCLLLGSMALAISSDNYRIDWDVIAGGGGRASSASHTMRSTIGQAAIGSSSSANFQLGAGYWYRLVRRGALDVYTNKIYYKPGKEDVAITVENVGTTTVGFDILPKVRIFDQTGRQVYPTIAGLDHWTLSPGQLDVYTWDQTDPSGNPVPCGEYTVKTVSELPDQYEATTKFYIRNIGYVIIVAGSFLDHQQSLINEGCDQVFDDLVTLGYDADRIYYLNPGPLENPRVDNQVSSANLEWAIETWAASRVSYTEPLFLYMFDHGTYEVFCVHQGTTWDRVFSSDLGDWLDTLQAATGASMHVIYVACHSGSFINELSGSGRVIITCCEEPEDGYFSTSPYWEYFAQYFWPKIKSGHSLADAFNSAVRQDGTVIGAEYHPLLDDNADGSGHRGQLPNDGDGELAKSVYIGGSDWIFPWIRYVIPKSFYAWPPPANITLWAEVENKTPLLHVRAWMLPSDWSPPPPDMELVETPFECFEMTDPDRDGNWTVDIPAVSFTNHASGPSDFKFMITAEEENGMTATPLWTGVEFTETGEPPPDNTPPRVNIECPINGQIVQGTISINGIATDDVCLEEVEVYVDGNLTGVINVPPTSNSFFELDFDTTTILEGTKIIQVKAFDTSNNNGTQTVSVTLANPVHNIDSGIGYAEIQEAIDATETSDGHTIMVDAGNYIENVNVYKSLNIIGTGASFTIVSAYDPNNHVFYVNASSMRIEGFTITGVTGAGKYGVYLDGADHSDISNNIIVDNYGGIFLGGCNDCVISGNTIDLNTYGAYLESSHGNLMYDNFFNNTNNAWDNGINFWNTTKQAGPNIIGGPYIGGNYWSDNPNPVDVDNDGIGDVPYTIPGDANKDYLPLLTAEYRIYLPLIMKSYPP